MTNRHRYVGADLSMPCEENFGGSALCVLPFASEWHFNDDDHPYQEHQEYPGECGWSLHGKEWAGRHCAGSKEDNMHSPDDEPTAGSSVTVTMEYPAQELPAASWTPPPGWKESRVYPPGDSDTSVLRTIGDVPVDPASLAKEAAEYRWEKPEERYTASGRKINPDGTLPPERGSVSEPVNTADEMPEWARAVAWLRMEGVGLTYGPWPMRKYVLPDLAAEEVEGSLDRTHYGSFERVMVALDALEIDYSLLVYRPKGAGYRVAWLTWDWAYGYTLEVACDELAVMYG